jgi:hypothetical protein
MDLRRLRLLFLSSLSKGTHADLLDMMTPQRCEATSDDYCSGSLLEASCNFYTLFLRIKFDL